MKTLIECLEMYTKGNHKLAIKSLELLKKNTEVNMIEWCVINYHLGVAYFNEGKDDKAMSSLKNSLKNDLIDKNLSSNAYYLIGLLYDQIHSDENEAIKMLKKSIDLGNFTKVEPIHYLSIILNGLGKHQENIDLLTRTIDLNPKHFLIYELCLLLGDTYSELNDFSQAINAYNLASEQKRHPFKAYYRLAGIYILNKNKEKAKYYEDLAKSAESNVIFF